MYIELHTASAFSFLEAASLPEALVDRAAALGYSALALVDRDGVYGAPRFHQAAKAAGLKAIVGAELTISEIRNAECGMRNSRKSEFHSNSEFRIPHSAFPLWRLPVLIESRDGYKNLCRLITRMKLRAPKGAGALALDELDGSTGGLVALAGAALLAHGHYGVGGLTDRLVGMFGRRNVYIEVQRHLLRDQEADNQSLLDLAAAFHVPVIATNGVRFAEPADRPLADVLTCVRHKTTLDRAGRRLALNAERYLKPPDAMARLFQDLPAAVAATRELADRLEYTMADLGYRFPDYPVPPGETMSGFLRKIAYVGARERYRPFHDRAERQLDRELDLIDRLDLAGYFLIVWDIVNFCRQHRILVQGRGSAANSAVCYSLGITAVDPVGMDLLFERFLSEERGEWPDIDIDLPSGDLRELVIQHVYEKYGRHGAAMTANVITYRGRSAAREVGKTLGIGPDHVDRLAKLMNNFEFVDPADTLPKHLAEAGLALQDPRIQLFGQLWERIQHLPRHLGQHSGGMVICQGRLDEVVPLENASMPGRVVVQWDKDDCADMGIVKVDLLGLGMLAVLQDAMAMVDGKIDLAHLPPDDPTVYRMLQEADTIGVFQVESRAQMATLPRLRPRTFYDIVVEVAIIRPGPIVGQMVHPYLKRRAGQEPVAYPHPSLQPILERTLGVPLFQEQLLRMAMVAAGFTGGEAEELRRAFGFKRSEARMAKVEARLRTGMAGRGITGDAAEEIIRSITSFALYGFPESHAASFALLVYASAYLKAHYPAAFYTALLNNQPMGFYHPATIVKDAQRHGVRFAEIDVQQSDWLCTVQGDGSIRLGLRYVNGLREQVGNAIASARAANLSAAGSSASSAISPCPKCGCDDRSMLERVAPGEKWFCNTCAHDWTQTVGAGLARPAGLRHAEAASAAQAGRPRSAPTPRFTSIEDLVTRIGLRRDELLTLAEIGALNAFGHHRRSALWQVEQVVRPAGELFAGRNVGSEGSAGSVDSDRSSCPLPAMSRDERLIADYDGTGLTIGPHPMAMRRSDLAVRGILRAADLPNGRHGRRVRVAGAVITRQRPGTAKGFVFLTLEDETGIANVIVRPDLFAAERRVIAQEPFVVVEGVLQIQEGVTSVRAERVTPLGGSAPAIESHDFH